MLPWLKYFTKKERPIDVLSNVPKPHLEEAYVKFSGKEIKPISKRRHSDYVQSNIPLLKKLQKKYGRKHMRIHTHPEGSLIPSVMDLMNFMCQKDQEAGVIVPLDKTNKYRPLGYFVLRKNKNYDVSKTKEKKFKHYIEQYHTNCLSGDGHNIANSLKKIAWEYNFNFRFFPAKKVSLTKEAHAFKNSRKSLESKLLIIPIVTFFVLLGLSNITGNAVSGFSVNTLNMQNIKLFALGLCFIGLVYSIGKYLNSNKPKI